MSSPGDGRQAVVVGSGPNGLAAAITLARAGVRVRVLEAAAEPGGGCRTAALTLPGFRHDVCSAIHPLAAASPCFQELDLGRHGLQWIESPAAVAHPLADAPAALLYRSPERTAAELGPDGAGWRRLYAPLLDAWRELEALLFGPWRVPPPGDWPALARFGARALRPAGPLAEAAFAGEPGRALFAGLAAHSMLPLERSGSAAVALVLGALAHRVGWPFPRGGAAEITAALVAELLAAGGSLETGRPVESLAGLSEPTILLDLTPRQVLAVAGDVLPPGYRRRLARYRYGPGVFKLDLALDGPVPWRDPRCAAAATVHVGGTLSEIAEAERRVWAGEIPPRPFVLLAQPSLFDDSRAPRGRHVVWAYCHAPAGSSVDQSAAVEAQIERFAPGFRDRIVARASRTAVQLEAYNPNCVGGDIGGGAADVGQLLTRPVASRSPWTTPRPGLFLCSSATPPGGGVHGVCGQRAARAALERSAR